MMKYNGLRRIYPLLLWGNIRSKQQADKILTHPVQPERKIGYLYLKPALPIRNMSQMVVLYEAHDVWPTEGIGVGFADGHVEWLRDQTRFKKLLGKTGGEILLK